jgi:HEAT repeat protein
LRPEEPAELDRILAARSSPDAAHRQVAARLLIGTDAETAEREWSSLLEDSNRSVRRAAVDAMVDADRPGLRALLERALLDPDAWTRWKAVRGLVGLGIEPSRSVVTPLADDPDFRVRLEATGALRVRG